MSFQPDDDRYEAYEGQFDPLKTDRKARRGRKHKVNHTSPPAAPVQETAALDGATNAEQGAAVQITYSASRYEKPFLFSSLQPFFDQGLVTDILAVVKGGKEASVYCCEATPQLGVDLLAAKVYRPRMFRSLSNDKMYRDGRDILTADGKAIKKTDHRIMRAVGKKTAFGAAVAQVSWLMFEYKTLETLYAAGAAVPKPYAASENAILMSYCGELGMAAPPLSDIRLDRDEAQPLFEETLRNIELMLQHGMIHGDLSAFNILYWEGRLTLIDFPQVTNPETNQNAAFILRRDVERVCEYFTRQGVKCDAGAIAQRLIARYVREQVVDPPEDF